MPTSAHPPEHYEQVAEIYDEAVEVGDPPTSALAETFGVPYSTAARWIRRARALGLLPSPRGGVVRGNVGPPGPPRAEERRA